MSITRLQQARQMFQFGGGADMGASRGPDGPPGGGEGVDRPTMADIAGPKTTTTQTMQEYMTDYATNVGKKADPRGGFFSDNTPEGKKNNLINNINFAPTKKPGFGILDLGLMLATGGLFGTKAKTAAQLFGTAKQTKNLVSDLSNTFGFENPIANMFSGNNKSTSKNNTTNNGGDGEGLASLENQASGYDEYILLLQKLQSGNISDSERNRFNVLKNMLGI